MPKMLTKQSGIALMIVLAAVSLLTAVAIEFAYSTNVNHHLALNDKERTQAYFLAESAIKLMALELKLEKQLRSSISSPSASAVMGNLSGPLCQQFPLSTSLLRSVFLTGSAPGGEPAKTDDEKGGKEAAGTAAFVGGMQVETAEEFLDFEGDFDGTCADESSKFGINIFAGKDPMQPMLSGLNDYDKSKQILMTLLSRPEFQNLFLNESQDKIGDIARNIADWVDVDDRMNEMGATATGSEDSSYPAGATEYRVKNGKFLTLDEIYMVAGVTDDWFTPIKDKFTIYGDGKINVCLASDEIVTALIVQYSNSRPNIQAVNPNDKEKIKSLLNIVGAGCSSVTPDVNQIASSVEAALGGGGGAAPAPAAGTSGGTTAGAGASGSGFAALITTQSRYYSLVGTGTVGDTVVRIAAVIDTKDPLPSRWKYVYWRVE